jgi:hypothetical protein
MEESLIVNRAVGRGKIVTVCEILSLQPPIFTATNFTMYVPGKLYVLVGLASLVCVPSPKYQIYPVVRLLVTVALLNAIALPAQVTPVVVNWVVGLAYTVITCLMLSMQPLKL